MKLVNVFLVVTLWAGCTALCNDHEDSVPRTKTDLCQELSKIKQLVAKEDSGASLSGIEAFLKVGGPQSQMMASAALYARDSVKYWSALLEHFSVNDYTDRSAGQYKMISAADMIGAVKQFSIDCPAAGQSEVHLLLAFCHFRDRNEWVMMGEQRVSAARFFRSSYLSRVLADAGTDVAALSSRIDRTVQMQLQKRDSSVVPGAE